MNILITGAKGFLGRNMAEKLKCIKEGKNRTRPNIKIEEIYEYDIDCTSDDLERFCSRADYVLHFAGVNRPKDQSEYMKGNYGFTSTLLDILKKYNNKAPVLVTSSVQATLSGRFGNSEYGRSKLAGEELIFAYGEETGASVYVFRCENIFGKWAKPNYNSAVATFAWAFANDRSYTVNDPATEIELIYVDDLAESIYDTIEGRPHRCRYDGAEALNDDNGRYCHCPVKHKVTLGYIIECLERFKAQAHTNIMPEMPAGSFEKKLFAVYLSYLPKEKTVYDLKMNVDGRGSFTELIKTIDHGQISVNISKPGITKGEHVHGTKWELFIVVKGHGLIRMRNLLDNAIEEYEVSGDRIKAVYMKPGWTHNIINLSETEDLVTIMFANEMFDPDHPDTFGYKVTE